MTITIPPELLISIGAMIVVVVSCNILLTIFDESPTYRHLWGCTALFVVAYLVPVVLIAGGVYLKTKGVQP